VPFIFVEGIYSNIFNVIALTYGIIILSSLLVISVIIPVLKNIFISEDIQKIESKNINYFREKYLKYIDIFLSIG
jgi:Cu/Ag efflux pump CusA